MYVCIHLFSDVPANPMSHRRLDRHSFLSIVPVHESKTCFFQILGTCFSLQPPMNCATSILRGRRRVVRPSPKKNHVHFPWHAQVIPAFVFTFCVFLFLSFCFSASVSVIVNVRSVWQAQGALTFRKLQFHSCWQAHDLFVVCLWRFERVTSLLILCSIFLLFWGGGVGMGWEGGVGSGADNVLFACGWILWPYGFQEVVTHLCYYTHRLSSNFQHALGVTFLASWSNIRHALDVTPLTSLSNM